MSPYQYWLDEGVKIFSLKFNFLRLSIVDLKTDKSDPSFLSVAQKTTYRQTYTKFLQYKKPQDSILLLASVLHLYTNPFPMTNLYTIDHSDISETMIPENNISV